MNSHQHPYSLDLSPVQATLVPGGGEFIVVDAIRFSDPSTTRDDTVKFVLLDVD